MDVFHYTSLDNWRGIAQGSHSSGGLPGLGPRQSVCIDNFDDRGARDGAVFGLLEPEPNGWVNNTTFPTAWARLMANVGNLLLTYELSNEIIDQSFLIDWAHRERVIAGYGDDLEGDIEPDTLQKERADSQRLYWASRIPLTQYAEQPDILADFELPEVITMCPIPFKLVRFADVQPRLKNLQPWLMEDLLRMIERSPDLAPLSGHMTAMGETTSV